MDWRRNNDPYVNQKFLGSQGGPAGPEIDGWVTYGNSVTNGLMFRDSVEIDEQKYPIRVQRNPSPRGLRGRGPPARRARLPRGLRPEARRDARLLRHRRMPLPAARCARRRRRARPPSPTSIHTNGEIEDLPTIANHDVQAGELLLHLLSGGGGYGDPLEREVERVRDDVLSQFITFERARDVYGVVFTGTELTDALAVDEAGTERQRERIRAGR